MRDETDNFDKAVTRTGEPELEAKGSKKKRRKLSFAVKGSSAGAGVFGLVGFFALFLVASLFFITENYFISMLIMSAGLMVYVTGLDMAKILMSSFAIFFTSRHLIEDASNLQEIVESLKKSLRIRRQQSGTLQADVSPDSVLTLPDNPLAHELKRMVEEGKDSQSAEYVAHSYYSECHELYDFSHGNLEFVANAMPLFGLIGTILGLIAMFDGLGANVTVESLAPQLALALKTTLYGAIFSSLYKIIASRFDQRQRTLEYDFETLNYALDVIFSNKNRIEVKA